MTEYLLIRTRRRTASLKVLPDGRAQVRAPLTMPRHSIDTFVESLAAWIERQRQRQRVRAEKYPEPTEDEAKALRAAARAELPPLVERYSALMGVTPAGLTITGARTRFGSCSGRNRLSFSWRLMRYPRAAWEAVVVHELAHIIHKDHKKGFYALVLSVLPDYYIRVSLLKE